MNDGTKIATHKVIWAAGITCRRLAGIPEESITWGGRLKVDAFHQVAGLKKVYAIGDLAYMEEEDYPKGHPQVAQVALQQAKNLAKNLKRAPKPPIPFHYRDLGSMATIGRNRAVVDLPRFKFQGAFAWLVWMFVHLFGILGTKNRLFVFLNWVWNYLTYDQSLRLIIRPHNPDRNTPTQPGER
jgi:NADH dehydrogenase